MAYQIAFDMYESAPQQFLWRVIEALRVTAPVPSAAHHIVTVPVEGNAGTSSQSGSSASDGATPCIDDDVEKRVENLVNFLNVIIIKFFLFVKKVMSLLENNNYFFLFVNLL